MYKDYQRWAEQNLSRVQQSRISHKAFSSELKQLGYKLHKRSCMVLAGYSLSKE